MAKKEEVDPVRVMNLARQLQEVKDKKGLEQRIEERISEDGEITEDVLVELGRTLGYDDDAVRRAYGLVSLDMRETIGALEEMDAKPHYQLVEGWTETLMEQHRVMSAEFLTRLTGEEHVSYSPSAYNSRYFMRRFSGETKLFGLFKKGEKAYGCQVSRSQVMDELSWDVDIFCHDEKSLALCSEHLRPLTLDIDLVSHCDVFYQPMDTEDTEYWYLAIG